MKLSEKIFLGRWFPFLLLLIMICTWAIQLPQVGFYLDDWVSLSGYDQGGYQALLDYSINDSRPVIMAWVLSMDFKIAGTSKIAWQIYSLFWRFLAGVISWALIRRLWPECKEIAAISAILFSIFPFFKHQALSITYNQIWMQYPVILGSFLLTAAAIQTQNMRKRIPLFLISAVLSAFQLLVTEYYLTFELLRIGIIWFALRPKKLAIKKRIQKTILYELPFLFIFFAYFFYRFFIMPKLIHDRNELEILQQTDGVLSMVVFVIQRMIQYITESVWGIWYRSINPANFDLTKKNTQAACAVGFLIAVLIFLILFRLRKKKQLFSDTIDSREIFLLGMAAAVIGFLPGIAIDKTPSSTFLYHDRFLIPSFWGISLSIAAAAATCLNGNVKKILILAALCGISTFFQIQNSATYRYAWESQQKFQWQMKWRVPDLQENTAILGDAIIASYMGGWADGGMVFEMYGKNTGHKPTPYWYFNMSGKDFWQEIREGLPLGYTTKMFETNMDSKNSVVITKPEWDRCLWLLDEADLKNPYIDPKMKELIPYQNKSRILYNSGYQMPTEIFGSDFRHDWCYYYEKAALAVDLGDYETVFRLHDEAIANGYNMLKPVEMTPFIRGAAMSGNWEQAAQWTIDASIEPHITWEYFKNLWELLFRDTVDSPARSAALEKITSVIQP